MVCAVIVRLHSIAWHLYIRGKEYKLTEDTVDKQITMMLNDQVNNRKRPNALCNASVTLCCLRYGQQTAAHVRLKN